MNVTYDFSPVFSMLIGIQATVDALMEFKLTELSPEDRQKLIDLKREHQKHLLKFYGESYPDVFGDVETHLKNLGD